MNSLIILCAKDLIYLTILLAVIFLLVLPNKKKKNFIIFGVITGAVAYLLAKIGGAIFYNARPFVSEHVIPLIQHAANNGFPSDHTLIASAIAVTIFMVSKKWGVGFMILAIIIGSARVMAHVHHPIDIIGSIIFALLGGVVAYYLTPKIEKLLHKPSHKQVSSIEES
jgi:undecaprenyl-diphosphatase